MVSAIDAIKQQVKNGLCIIFSSGESFGKAVGGIVGTTGDGGGLGGAFGTLVCDRPPAPLPAPAPPFTGGQCDGLTYRIYFSYNVINTDGSTGTRYTENRGAIGPIYGVRGVGAPDFQSIVADTGQGDQVLTSGNCAQGCFRDITIDSVEPFFASGVDNCGDPPVAPITPEPVSPTLPDITFNIDVDTTITVPITAVYAPIYVDLDGSFKMPISVNVGDIDLSGTINIAPEFSIELSPTINLGGPGTPDDPDVIGEPDGGPTPIPDVEDLESTIIGVLVYSDIEAEAGSTGVAFTNGPNLYVPRLASVQFAVKTRDSIGWTSDLDVKNLECYVPCPAPQGAIAVRVSSMPGVQSRFTPVRGVPLTSFEL